MIPRELGWKCSQGYRIDALDRVRTQNVERAIFHEFGEGAAIEPEKLPNPRKCALNFGFKLFAGEVCQFRRKLDKQALECQELVDRHVESSPRLRRLVEGYRVRHRQSRIHTG